MQYLAYFILVAVGFGLIALCDWLLKKLLFRRRREGAAVRLPRYSFLLGLFLTLLGFVAVLYLPRSERALWFGCWVVLIIGLYVLVNFFWTGIFYDDETFTVRALGRKTRTYRYGDITSQRGFLAKSGWNSLLYAAGEEVQLYAAMQGLSDFLNKAFFAWCRANQIDPDTVENDPHNLIFFPDPEEDADNI